MHTCFQTLNITVLDHGHSVFDYFMDLMGYLFEGTSLKHEWRLPEWFTANTELIKDNLLSLDIMRDYLVYHDCGKPVCLEIDELGRSHFRDHAAHSKERWLECAAKTDRNVLVGELIGMDMDFHLIKGDGLEAFAKRPEAISLMVAGLAELHSNASMFGGTNSTSFKIKYKHTDKRGRQLLTLVKKNESHYSIFSPILGRIWLGLSWMDGGAFYAWCSSRDYRWHPFRHRLCRHYASVDVLGLPPSKAIY